MSTLVVDKIRFSCCASVSVWMGGGGGDYYHDKTFAMKILLLIIGMDAVNKTFQIRSIVCIHYTVYSLLESDPKNLLKLFSLQEMKGMIENYYLFIAYEISRLSCSHWFS